MTGPDAGRPGRGTPGRTNTEQGEALEAEGTPPVAYEVGGTVATAAEFGTILRLAGEPEVVAAELVEKAGPTYGRSVAAWVLILAEEVGQ